MVKGYWKLLESKEAEMAMAYCSNCGFSTLNAAERKHPSNYCPHCGADMRDGLESSDDIPRAKGSWVFRPYIVGSIEVSFPCCSVCKKTMLNTSWNYPSRFCPNCGSDNRE